MASNKASLLKAIEIGTAAKAYLLHAETVDTFEVTARQEEFCGSSLFGAQIGIRPMLLAFSMELALKAWIVFDTKEDAPTGHNLSKLFFFTSAATQERLKARYDREISPYHPSLFYKDDGLERVLKNARRAFVDWRYIHELDEARFDTGVFSETINMILSEFESRIHVVKCPPLFTHPAMTD